jgi:hypothetical protein
MLETLERTSNLGFCEICCNQITSPQFRLFDQAKELWYISRQALFMIAKAVGTVLFTLVGFLLFLFREREKTALEIEADEREMYLDEYSLIRHKFNKLSSSRLDPEDEREDEQSVDDVNGLRRKCKEGLASPKKLVERADDTYRKRLDAIRKREARDLDQRSRHRKQHAQDLVLEREYEADIAPNETRRLKILALNSEQRSKEREAHIADELAYGLRQLAYLKEKQGRYKEAQELHARADAKNTERDRFNHESYLIAIQIGQI